MVRLFVGSFLQTDEALRIEQLEENFAAINAVLRYVSAAKLHITWAFIGEVQNDQVEAVKAVLGASIGALKDWQGQNLKYDTLEVWPSPENARVLVATPSVVQPSIKDLGETVRQAIKKFRAHCLAQSTTMPGQTIDSEDLRQYDFRPHLTLARFKKEINIGSMQSQEFNQGDLLATMGTALPVHQTINDLHLVNSHSGLTANEYQIIKSF